MGWKRRMGDVELGKEGQGEAKKDREMEGWEEQGSGMEERERENRGGTSDGRTEK